MIQRRPRYVPIMIQFVQLYSIWWLFLLDPPIVGVVNAYDMYINGFPETYESWSAETKYKFWSHALQEEAKGYRSGLSGHYPSVIGQFLFLTSDKFHTTFDHFGDNLPYDHEKRIRSVGGVGMVEWIPSDQDDHSYTGFFTTGTPYGLIRLSYTRQNDSKGTTPGLALKLFRNGQPSSNILAMESLEGQSSGNFFQYDMSNHLSPPKTLLLKYVSRRFSRYSCPSTKVGLSEIAIPEQKNQDNDNTNENSTTTSVTYTNETTILSINTNMRQEESEISDDIEFPYRIIFRPNPSLTEQFADYPPDGNLFDILTNIKVGTKLYDLYAIPSPLESEIEIHIGHLVLKQSIQASVMGDTKLFFRHSKIENDYKNKPEFNIHQRNENDYDYNDIEEEVIPKCPARFLFS